MNYKVMQRPMFKMGGKAASQGTGITSGLDEKVNMAIGGGVIKGDNLGTREGFKEPDFSGMSLEDLINERQKIYNKSMSGLSDMRDIVRLQTLGNLATNVLPNIERGGLTGVVDFLKDPMTTQQAISGLTGLKRVDLKEKELKNKSLDRLISGKIDLEKLDIARSKANKELDREIRLRLGDEAQLLIDSVGGDKSKLSPSQFREYERKMKISMGSGFLTESEAKAQAYQIASNIFDIESIGNKKFMEEVEKIASSLYYGSSFRTNEADGGRVNRRMGSDDNGELPPDPTKPVNPFQPKPIKPLGDGKMAFDDTPRFELKSLDALMNEFEADNGRKPTSIDDLKRYFYNKYGEDFLSKIDQAVANESKDVAMETQGRGNQVFDMLRARLPQEITDDVVQLISYNKEAFADFASIKNQEDVTSFNEKYGVQLVIDVATV
jgi:hypothetical protein